MRAITIIGAFLVLLAGLALWPMVQQNTIAPHATIPPAGLISLRGEMVCLPHKDTTGAQTLECAYGLLGNDGNYYTLQSVGETPSLAAITSIPTGSAVDISGEFTPAEDAVYATVGSIAVQSINPINAAPTSSDTASERAETNDLHSNGVIAFSRPEDFGLAISDAQILTDSAIPPCESGFDYCLYYLGEEYAHTNFLSAGVAIVSRQDLTSESTCLTTAPVGYIDLEPAAITTNDSYSVSVFTPLGDAATGQYTNSTTYRIYTAAACYELTARVAEAQFANFPIGTVEEFTVTDRADMFTRLNTLIESMTLSASGQHLILP